MIGHRHGDGRHDDDMAKLLATTLLTLRGVPFLCYGEEIGMVATEPRRREDVRGRGLIRLRPRSPARLDGAPYP